MPAALAGGNNGGMFDFIMREGGQTPPSAAPVERRPAHVSSSGPAASTSIGQQRTYCVRTCDGYYFSIGFVRSKADLAAHAAMCGSSCGGGGMVLYSTPLDTAGAAPIGSVPTGPAIQRAVNDAGQPYSALPTAYAFRDAPNPSCACKSTASGLPQIPISIDPTLRNGDIIVMQDGLKIFRGDKAGPHDDTDFVSASNAKSLSTVVRQQMLLLQNRIAQ